MRAKKVIFLSSLVILLFALVILSLFVFMALKEVRVNFLLEPSSIQREEILETLQNKNILPYNQSTLLLNKAKILDEVEKNVPELQVKGIVVCFPNILRIDCIERTPIYYVSIKDTTKIAVLDKYMKVIKLDEQSVIQSLYDLELLTILDIQVLSDNEKFELGTNAMFKYNTQLSSVTQAITILQVGNDSTFCSQFKKVEVCQGFANDGSGKKQDKLNFYTASNIKVVFENTSENTSIRIQRLLGIATDDNIDDYEIHI